MSASKNKPKTVKAWGYLCRDGRGKYTLIDTYTTDHKPYCVNPPVRVRIVRETDWKKIERKFK